MPSKKPTSKNDTMRSVNRKEGGGKTKRTSKNTGTCSRRRKAKSTSIELEAVTISNMIDLKNNVTRLKLSECLLWNILHQNDSCNSNSCDLSKEEAEGIVDAMIESILEQQQEKVTTSLKVPVIMGITTTLLQECLMELLMDYVPDLENEQYMLVVTNVINHLLGKVNDYTNTGNENSNNDEEEDDSSTESNYNNVNNEDDDDDYIDSDDDENYLQEGECELCERDNARLTRHHLIPRSTWPRIKPRFQKAAPYFHDGDIEQVQHILSIGPIIPTTPDLLSSRIFSSRSQLKQFLSCYTCTICSLCHKMVHKRFNNMELAETWNSVDKLLEDEQIRKFCKWANKQKSKRRYN